MGIFYKYPQSMFKSKNKYLYTCVPVKLKFYYIKVGFHGVKLYMLDCLHDWQFSFGCVRLTM